MGRMAHTSRYRATTTRAFIATLTMSTALGFGLVLPVHDARAQAQVQTRFSIPAGTLSQALTAYGRQAGVQVTYLASVAVGKMSPGFSGSASREQALAAILQGSGLVYSFPNATTAAISEAAAGGALAGDGTVLQTIVVSGNGNQDNATVAADNSTSATKLDTPLIETARSVSVVTRKEIEQRGAQDIVEAVNYSAGVTTGRAGYDPRFDVIEIRGYDATTMGDYKDGLRQPYVNYGMFRTDPYSLERVEVVKGPVSVLYGAGTPAGIVNKVSKVARPERIREVEVFYGTANRKQLAFDIGDTLGDGSDFSYRLVGLARKGETNFSIADDRYLLQPSFTWTPSDQTSLTVYGLVQNSESDASISAITFNGRVLPLRGSDPDYDYQRIQQQQIGYTFEHEFNDNVKFRQDMRYSHLDLKGRYLAVSTWTGTVGNRAPWAVTDDMNVFQVDNQLQWSFDTGVAAHTLLTGVDYTQANGFIGYGIGAVDPAYAIDITNPFYGHSGATAPYNYLLLNRDLKQTGIYAIDQIDIDRWHFTVGGRYTWVDRNGNGTQGGAAYIEDIEKSAFTMQASALYAFDNGFSPYFSYATSFEPVNNLPVPGTVLDAAEGEQFEIGVKYQPPGSDIMLSATAYHLVEENKAVVADAALGTYQSIGEVTSKGIELEARANIDSNWDMIGAYTYAHSRITGGDKNIGNTPAVKPEHVFSLWANYTFDEGTVLAGLSAGAGVRYASSAYNNLANTTKNGSTLYMDAALSYDFGAIDKNYDGLLASFNVRNIADRRDAICNEGYCSLAQGRNVTASLKYRW